MENVAGTFCSGVVCAEVGGDDRRLILVRVSVDLGCTMLPVSPQISLCAESPLSTGTVECCRRARVSEFCFTLLSPEHTLYVNHGGRWWFWVDVVHPRCAGINCSKKDPKVCVRVRARGAHGVVNRDDVGCDELADPGVA